MIETWAAVASAALAAFALLFTWEGIRERSLRREDVYSWCIESIKALNSLYLIIYLSRHEQHRIFDTSLTTKELIFTTSNLVEQGRLFFKNSSQKKYGAGKKPAYRGFRPEILDYLVLGHQIACRWQEADEKERAAMEVIADDCVKSFVSLAQHEVGRKRTASKYTQAGGDGANLSYRIHKVSSDDIGTLRPYPSVSAAIQSR